MATIPLIAPIYLPGQEPLPPGVTPEEADAYRQAMKYQKIMTTIPESCPFKVVLSGGMGFALGGFFSLMSATFAVEDPMSRASTVLANQGTKAQTMFVIKEMGRNAWSSGKGFAKVGALYSGIECCIEGVRWSRHMNLNLAHLSIEQRTIWLTLLPVVSSLVRFLPAIPVFSVCWAVEPPLQSSPVPSTGICASLLPSESSLAG